MKIEELIRPNIRNMKPYSSARDEFTGLGNVYLDANENPYNLPFNRYPDPHQLEIKEKLSGFKHVSPNRIFLGNGSDEPIDLIIRMTCIPGKSNLIVTDPTYGMYQVSAVVNDVEVRKVPLTADFQLDPDAIHAAWDADTRLLFLCSPNNPTGNALDADDLEGVIRNFQGIVVLDEAYADFSKTSLLNQLDKFPNLIILQTFSKAWGLAGLRVGVAYASEYLTMMLDRIKPPYNINQLSQELVLKAMANRQEVKRQTDLLIKDRERLKVRLQKISIVEKIFPSDANFLLVKFDRSQEVFRYLLDLGIIVRDRSSQRHCEGCLRITIGVPEENDELVQALKEFK